MKTKLRNAKKTPIRRGELAKLTGCNLETIRYYEKIGLMTDTPREENGYRAYDENLVRRLRFILRARELGFTVEQIRGLLALTDGGHQTCTEVKARTLEHLDDIHTKILDLKRIERVLTKTADRCSGRNVPECPILDILGS